MFDYINCKYKLPEVDLTGTSLTQEDLGRNNQTKDLDNSLQAYTIEEDGRISYTIYKNCTWAPADNNDTGPFARLGRLERSEPETHYITGHHTIEFGNYVQKNEDEFDYSWDWEATVIDGVVDTITFKGLKKIDNKDRKRFDAEYKQRNLEELKFRKTLWFKLFVKHVRSFRNYIRRKIIKLAEVFTKIAYKL